MQLHLRMGDYRYNVIALTTSMQNFSICIDYSETMGTVRLHFVAFKDGNISGQTLL